MMAMKPWIKVGLLAVVLLAAAALAVRYARPVFDFLSNEQLLQAWLDRLGPLGPLGVIILNAAQVVVAFIPGYAMSLAAGFLYGFPVGALYGAIGMAIGGLVAMLLARVFGRPLVTRMVGEKRMQRWEEVARLDSLPIWFILMLGPFGDVPYYIAGLTTIALWKIIVIALALRTPSILVTAAVGAGLVDWHSPWVIGGAVLLMGTAVAAMRYQAQIETFVDQRVLPQAVRLSARPKRVRPSADAPLEAAEYDAAAR
jgi:uncharacterized membrane protein YdjX (TVP38/TMEM64 family)